MAISWIDENPAARELYELGIIDPEAVTLFSERCRDADVRVFRCASSGVVFLESALQTSGDYYINPPSSAKKRYGITDRPPETIDDPRRSEVLASLVADRQWLDFGAGAGSLLDVVRDGGFASGISAVEPNLRHRREISERGYSCFASLEEMERSGCDAFGVVSMFHVLEHLHSPITALRSIRSVMTDDAVLVVEVPHSQDALLSIYENEAFKRFTLWSEHLVLHTEDSLQALIAASGFQVMEIVAVQRYPLSNHLFWLSRGLPGGHVEWSQLSSADLDASYAKLLADHRSSDTLLAFALLENQ